MSDLSEQDRERITDLLSRPLDFPSEFRSWLPDWLSINIPPIPVSQLLGYKGTLANVNIVNDAESVNSSWDAERTWVDLPSYGPEIAGLADGVYFAIWGAFNSRGATGAADCHVGPSVNGADPTFYTISYFMTDQWYPNWCAAPLIVRNGTDNNAVTLKYWYDLSGGASAGFQYRWLVVLRVT